jgi:hypothetical protein
VRRAGLLRRAQRLHQVCGCHRLRLAATVMTVSSLQHRARLELQEPAQPQRQRRLPRHLRPRARGHAGHRRLAGLVFNRSWLNPKTNQVDRLTPTHARSLSRSLSLSLAAATRSASGGSSSCTMATSAASTSCGGASCRRFVRISLTTPSSEYAGHTHRPRDASPPVGDVLLCACRAVPTAHCALRSS